jgi:hypothetical protein
VKHNHEFLEFLRPLYVIFKALNRPIFPDLGVGLTKPIKPSGNRGVNSSVLVLAVGFVLRELNRKKISKFIVLVGELDELELITLIVVAADGRAVVGEEGLGLLQYLLREVHLNGVIDILTLQALEEIYVLDDALEPASLFRVDRIEVCYVDFVDHLEKSHHFLAHVVGNNSFLFIDDLDHDRVVDQPHQFFVLLD